MATSHAERWDTGLLEGSRSAKSDPTSKQSSAKSVLPPRAQRLLFPRSVSDSSPESTATRSARSQKLSSLRFVPSSTHAEIRRIGGPSRFLLSTDIQFPRRSRSGDKFVFVLDTSSDYTRMSFSDYSTMPFDSLSVHSGRVNETTLVRGVGLFADLIFESELILERRSAPYNYIGAGIGSALVLAVRSMTLVPADPTTFTGRLILNQADVSKYCASEMIFVPTIGITWTIVGSISAGFDLAPDLTLLIDSTEHGIHVPHIVYMKYVTHFSGREVREVSGGFKVLGCRKFPDLDLMPPLIIRVANMITAFTGSDFTNFDRTTQTCTVKLKSTTFSGRYGETHTVLGTWFLEKVVVQFNRSDDNIGLCHVRTEDF
jgi:hypothetical protein